MGVEAESYPHAMQSQRMVLRWLHHIETAEMWRERRGREPFTPPSWVARRGWVSLGRTKHKQKLRRINEELENPAAAVRKATGSAVANTCRGN